MSVVKSMTGYGRSVKNVKQSNITVEVRTVNHRFLDISTKMPRSLMYLEDTLKKKIKSVFHRGRVDVYITIDGEGLTNRTLQIDWELMDQFVSQLKQAKEKYNLSGDISVQALTEMDELITVQEEEDNDDDLEKMILSSLEEALHQVVEMREKEGQALNHDILARISTIQNIVEELQKRRPVVMEETRKRIKARIEEYTKEEILEQDSRILQEVGLLAERGDIAEEITRLYSHINQLTSTLKGNDAIGRKLDFIVQEMNRESNTIGSKSNDSKVSEWVILLKSDIEKIKEQVQNVE